MIEDFTLRGIDDLKNRIVRTPLAALETFREDPLRILRTIRFATRYCCEIDPPILEATHEPDIESALSRKVSRNTGIAAVCQSLQFITSGLKSSEGSKDKTAFEKKINFSQSKCI